MADEQPYLYLTTTGWKTGKQHEIEIWFVPYEGCFYLVAEHRDKSHWVQNIQHQPNVTWRVGETHYSGSGRAVDPTTEPEVARAVSALMDAKYQWSDGLIVELAPVS
ncbi:MAG: nitroreductase/quinone reductase family protein [bacterium]|nr:nitroreductase/quinone reductase family protein [bacterium]